MISCSPELIAAGLSAVAGEQRTEIAARERAGPLEARPAARLGAVEPPQLDPHLRALQRHGGAIDDRSMSDLHAVLLSDQEAGKHAGRDHDVGTALDQR